jgi:hypothetical protein
MYEHCIIIGGIVDNINKFTCMTYEGAARILNVSVWRLRYAVDSGYLEAPSVLLKRRALFSPEQVKEMNEFFEREDMHRRKEPDMGSSRRVTERSGVAFAADIIAASKPPVADKRQTPSSS